MDKELWLILGGVLAGIFVGAAVTEVLNIRRRPLVSEVRKSGARLGEDVSSVVDETKRTVLSGWKQMKDAFKEGYAESMG